MLLEDITGNEKIVVRLGEAAISGNLFHAYIFEGDSSIDKVGMVKAFIKAIFCTNNKGEGCSSCISCRKIDDGNYEDIHFAEAAGASIKDEIVSDILRNLKNKPVGGNRNIAIIKDADTMTVKAQNRLLKTLEEPPEGTVIFLLSENSERLLQTVRSRCLLMRLEPTVCAAEEDIEILAREIAAMLRDRKTFKEVRDVLSDILTDKENGRRKTLIFLDVLERFYRDAMVGIDRDSGEYDRRYVCEAIGHVETARKDIQINIAYSYALKNMIIEIGG